MDAKAAFLSFIERINDGYIAGHTINSLITDNEYQRLTVRNGKAIGTPLGNKHILPGYWFTVLIAPFEAFDRVLECVRLERENTENNNNNNNNQANSNTDSNNDLWQLTDDIKKEFDELFSKIAPPLDVKEDTFPNKKPLIHIRNAISHGCYDLGEVNGDAFVTFTDYDQLCGYQFVASIAVTILNKFASEFLYRICEVLYSMIERCKGVAKMVQTVSMKELFP